MRRSRTGGGVTARKEVHVEAARPLEEVELRPPYSADTPVLPYPGAPLFGSDEWDLAGAINSPNQVTRTNWSTVREGPWRLAAREYAYVRLNEHGLGNGGRWKPEGINAYASRFAVLAEACIAIGAQAPGELDRGRGALLLDLARESGDLAYYAQSLSFAVQLFQAQRFLTDAPREHPFEGLSPFLALGVKGRTENKTPRIPAEIWSLLLSWTSRFIDEFADQILAERRWRIQLGKQPRTTSHVGTPSHGGAAQVQRIQIAVAVLRAAGRGLPYIPARLARKTLSLKGADPRLKRLSLLQLAKLGGTGRILRRQLTPAAVGALNSALAEIGFQDERVRDHLPNALESLLPDGFAELHTGLSDAEQMLMVACAILVAAYTGMRPSELASLKPGCCEPREVTGRARPRYFLKGTAYKDRINPEPTEWVTIEDAAKAVVVAEHLLAIWGQASSRDPTSAASEKRCIHHEKGTLFILDPRDLASVFGSGPVLNRFRDYVNRLAEREGTPGIPLEHGGNPFRLQWRQFRRTLAWFIGQQPMGWAAGPWQYKHLGIELFSAGYHGSSKSDFRQEVATWDAKRRWNIYEEMRVRAERGDEVPVGPAAPRLMADFAATAARRAMLRGEVHPERYLMLIQQEKHALYPGEVNDCYYDEAKAVCAKKTAMIGTQEHPNWALCEPGHCGNASFRSIHRLPWEKKLVQIEGQLRETKADVQRAQLERVRSETKQVLTEIGKSEKKYARQS